MWRFIVKTIIPNRWLVALRLAIQPEFEDFPLVAVPPAAGLLRRVVSTYGYGRSIVENAPVDASGSPIPWYTYPMVEYLDSFDLSELRVFEYGCGNSTLWWAARVREVVSVEDKPEWYAKVSEMLPANSQLLLEADESRYSESIKRFGSFDLIVVDGIVRYQCCVEAVKHLNPGGAIILDNSDCLPRSTAFLRSTGLFEVAINGFTPLISRASRTSLFLSQPSRLRFKPHRPALAGAVEDWDENTFDLRADRILEQRQTRYTPNRRRISV